MVNNHQLLKFWLICIIMIVAILGSGQWVLAASNGDVMIDAAGGVDYDTATNVTVANQQVKLTDGKITIEADHLTYNADTGLVIASGGVKVTRNDEEYRTETLSYNLKGQTGSTEGFNGIISGQDRNVKISGSSLNFAEGTHQITDGTMTRCPLDNPHYTLTAKKITFGDNKITFEKVVLRLRGIPVWYLRKFTWRINQENNFPRIEGGYTASDGTLIKISRFNESTAWYVSGKTKDGGYLEAGLANFGKLGSGAYQNTIWGGQELAGFSRAGDKFVYNGQLFQFTTDGYYTFGGTFQNEEGLSLTRKYWHTGAGDWQFGLEARRMVEWSGTGSSGGVWGGFRLDYQPVSNLTLSYMQRNDVNGLTKADYGSFDPNLGSSILADLEIPLSENYRLGISGTYNLTDQKLRENYFRVYWNTCCYNVAAGWNSVDNTVELTGNINF